VPKFLRLIRDIQLGLKNLLLHKLRSFLTMLGVVFGVGSVIAMLAVGEGANQEALEQIRRLGSTVIILNSSMPVEEEAANSQRNNFMSVFGLLYADEARIRETFDAVVRAVPVRLARQEARVGSRRMDVRVVGTTPDWFALVDRTVISGRTLQERDMTEFAPVCVITEQVARRLLATEHVVGQKIRLGSQVFDVIGVVQAEGGAGGGQQLDFHNDIYLPMHVFRERFGEVIVQRSSGSRSIELVELHQIIAEIRSIEEVETAAASMEAMLQRFHPKEDYTIHIPLSLLRQAEATKRTFNIVLGSIAGISLLVGGIGIMNIMLASVTERTREIGVRRAIGARRSQIISQFLVETVVLSSIGGAIGMGVGVAIPWTITQLAGMPTVVTTSSLMLAAGISMSIGIIFGLYPAYRAAMLDPIVALRHE
jgi:putative ABC transport system permease protein